MTSSSKLFLREANRRTKDDSRDMGKVDMRPRDPYEILGLKPKKKPADTRCRSRSITEKENRT
jgi:hypothetical protein